MMLFYETFCSVNFVVVFLQVVSVASAVNIEHFARSTHLEDIYDAAPISKRSLATGGTKRALGGVQPTLLVAERHNIR